MANKKKVTKSKTPAKKVADPIIDETVNPADPIIDETEDKKEYPNQTKNCKDWLKSQRVERSKQWYYRQGAKAGFSEKQIDKAMS